MFAFFLDIIFKSIKLDKSLYTNSKYFGEAGIYFAGLIMILDGVAGAIAANTVIKTSIGVSGITAIFAWFFWSILIYVIGVKLFPDKNTKASFKNILVGVGYAHAPGLLRFFAVVPEMVFPIIFLTQFWIFASLIISMKQVLNLKSNFKSFGIIFLSFLIIFIYPCRFQFKFGLCRGGGLRSPDLPSLPLPFGAGSKFCVEHQSQNTDISHMSQNPF